MNRRGFLRAIGLGSLGGALSAVLPARAAAAAAPLAAPARVVYGRCLNVAPLLIDPTRLIYQFHDGNIEVENVYDRGIRLTRAPAGNVPGPGQYAADPRAGTIRLGLQPCGVVTGDVVGAALPSHVFKQAELASGVGPARRAELHRAGLLVNG